MATILQPVERATNPGLTFLHFPSDVYRIVNNLLIGKTNNVLDVSIPAATTGIITIQSSYINELSWIGIMTWGGTSQVFRIVTVRDAEVDIERVSGPTDALTLRVLVVG